MSLESTVQRLQDRVDILEMMYAYCRHADQLNAKAMTAFFTEDCVVSYLAGQPPIQRGRAELEAFLTMALSDVISGSHHIANVELIFDTPDQVTAHTYMYSWQRFEGYPHVADCHRWGRYEDRLVRTRDGWRFSRMQLMSAGEYGGARIAEQMNRPWPPRFAD